MEEMVILSMHRKGKKWNKCPINIYSYLSMEINKLLETFETESQFLHIFLLTMDLETNRNICFLQCF